jgi:hypothetical protein
MANTPQKAAPAKATQAGTREVPGAENAAPLTPEEQNEVRAADTADVSPRAAGPDLSGERVRAVFYGGGTTKEVSKRDFARFEIDHPSVVFDFRKDDATLRVDPPKGFSGLTKEAADFLTSRFPTEFEYVDQGDSNDSEE